MHSSPSRNPFVWYARCFRRFADFEGRARRWEYWSFTFVNVLVAFVIGFIGALAADDPSGTAAHLPGWIYIAIVFVPSLAVSVRRLHDTGRSGLWLLLQFIPYVGALVLLVFMAMDGDDGPNGYGHSPKSPEPMDLGELEQVFG